MRSASTALSLFIATKQPFWSADLFTIELANTTSLKFTSSDADIGVYKAASSANISIERTSWQIKNTVDVPKMQVTITSTGTDYTGGANFKHLVHNGLLDGAWVYLDRAIMPIIGGQFGNTSLGTVGLFYGLVGEVTIDGLSVKIDVLGANTRMQEYMPRNVFQYKCNNALYDSKCGVSKASFTYTGTVGAANRLAIDATADPTGGNLLKLANGTITMTSGAAAGTTRTIRGIDGSGSIVLYYPLYDVPAPGDTFSVSLGCDKMRDGGCTFFNNTGNFRGFRFIPAVDQVL